MALSTFAITIAVMLVVFLYSLLKLVKWGLNADEKQLSGQYVNHATELFRLCVVAVVLLALGPPIGNWLTNAFNFIIQVL